MIATRTTMSGGLAAHRSTVQMLKGFSGASRITVTGTKPVHAAIAQQPWTQPHRTFSSTPARPIKEYFETADAPQIRKTEAAWPHPM